MEWTETANDPHTPTKQRSTLRRLCRKTVHFVLPVFLACSILTSTTVYAEGEKTMDVCISPVENLVYSGKAQNLMPSSVSIKDKDGQTDITGAAITYTVLTEKQDGVSSLSYNETSASSTDAGTYYVYYKATKDGYAPAYGDAVVTIQKKPVMLTWTIQDGTTQAYTENPISPPTASCSESGVTPTVTLTSPAGITDPPSDVGTYVYTATVDNPNYEITNPTCTVKITGQTITGYTLTPYGGDGILFDAQEHDAGSLQMDSTATEGVTIQYQLDDGDWVDEMPKVRAVGEHQLKVGLTKTGYEESLLESTVTILPVSYVTERCDYLAGWDLVLAYTNTDATFTYDGISMYELTSLGYQYGETQYAHVYGALVHGYGNVTLVTPSSLTAKSIMGDGSELIPYDVNHSGNVDIYDVVAVQAVYNIREEYFAEDKIPIVLRADVNGDKKVDTSDCNLIKEQ